MRLTNCLCKQHIGFNFKQLWHLRSKKAVIVTKAEAVLKSKGIPVCKATDLLPVVKDEERLDVVGVKPKPIPLDETHPNWNARQCLMFRDDNVLLEGLTQAKIVTKTVELEQNHLPTQYTLQEISKSLDKRVKSCILSSHLFDAEQQKLPKIKDPLRPAWNFPRTYGITDKRKNHLIITKLLQLLESSCDYNLIKERYLSHNLHFSFPFEKGADLYQLCLRGDTVMTSSKPLPPLTNVATEQLKLPDIHPIKHTITFNNENIYELQNFYPINKSVTKLHPHTVFVHYNGTEVKNLYEEPVTEQQIFGRSLLKAFTVAASYARQQFGDNAKVLQKPVTVQCVQTDGRLFHFGVLQLNTLDLQNDDGIKNVWYQTPHIPLFDSCSYELGKPTLSGYNNDVVKHLFAFYNNY